jgi:hypothetical protein
VPGTTLEELLMFKRGLVLRTTNYELTCAPGTTLEELIMFKLTEAARELCLCKKLVFVPLKVEALPKSAVGLF